MPCVKKQGQTSGIRQPDPGVEPHWRPRAEGHRIPHRL